jgi:hypothetical protein
VQTNLELLTLTELSRLAKRSRRALYSDIAAGRLRVIKLGKSTRVTYAEAERYLAGDSATLATPSHPLTRR